MPKMGISNVGYGNVTPTIFAGLHGDLKVSDIIIVSGQNLVTGTLLGKITASGKYKKMDTGASDGSQSLAGILGCDCNATSADEKAFMYVHGEFNKAELNSTQAVVAGSYNYGSIVIREEY